MRQDANPVSGRQILQRTIHSCLQVACLIEQQGAGAGSIHIRAENQMCFGSITRN
jgi:hypothetical protein